MTTTRSMKHIHQTVWSNQTTYQCMYPNQKPQYVSIFPHMIQIHRQTQPLHLKHQSTPSTPNMSWAQKFPFTDIGRIQSHRCIPIIGTRLCHHIIFMWAPIVWCYPSLHARTKQPPGTHIDACDDAWQHLNHVHNNNPWDMPHAKWQPFFGLKKLT